MPIYEYQCQLCGHPLEELQKITDPVLVDCPECGKPGLQRLVSHSSFQLKGGGWYATDYKKETKPAIKTETKAADKPQSSQVESSKSDAAPEVKKSIDNSGEKKS